MMISRIQGIDGQLGIECRFDSSPVSFTRVEVIDRDGVKGIRCEHSEPNGEQLANAMLATADTETPDGIRVKGDGEIEETWGWDKVDLGKVDWDQCTGTAKYLVTICDCPETIDEPDEYLLCSNCAAHTLGMEVLSGLK